ncbi:glycosyltransferase family 2 protein [Winogradskyella aurantiaca]|uniref:glycosyltransferase family 2 protein n=1 Tax=Winogradskyella aurantiaca TaxID=2219558 RepID=UPI000E1C95C2|nr:glycosyltransferase family 2 protein [Winogradskyella aurantiaca]
MDISVVIPLLNEEESIKELYDWIASVMQSNHFSYEILFIDDGSNDSSWSIISTLAEQHPEVKGIKFRKNYGKSQALHAGFYEVGGDVIITMDADLQDNPEEIPELFQMITSDGYDLVSGWKKKRYDSVLSKNLPSKLFNWAARRTSQLKLHDFNCGLKAYKNEVVKSIDVYGEMHRYIPVLAKNAGYGNISEKIVKHQARKYGKTKFGMDRFINGFLDLMTISFLSRFGKRPMHFFGAIGVLMLILGFGFSVYLGVDKLFLNPKGRLITERPQFYLALTTMILGALFFVAGFLGELILRSSKSEKLYEVESKINL